ncbi:hypothetical protein MMC11_003545 [Xylographa trunciseda]|nr:hypothetical protein [Xylographa trunciseda]
MEDSGTDQTSQNTPLTVRSPLTKPSHQHESIDFSSRIYTLSTTAASAFETPTSFPATLIDHLKSLTPLAPDQLTTLTADCRLTVPPHAVAALRQHWSLPSAATYPTSIELIGATLRQGRFVDTMAHHLWIRSPALPGTLSRARARYTRYFALLAAHPGQPMVPTIDIDLVWHTHQQAPAAYHAFSLRATGGRFVNHADTIDNAVRKGGLGVVRDLWWRKWGEEYARCFCWDCELLLGITELEQQRSSEGLAVGRLEDRGVVEKRAQKVAETVGFYRAVEMARRKGGMLPAKKA